MAALPGLSGSQQAELVAGAEASDKVKKDRDKPAKGGVSSFKSMMMGKKKEVAETSELPAKGVHGWGVIAKAEKPPAV